MLHHLVRPFATPHTRHFCSAHAPDPARAEGSGDAPVRVSAHAPSSRGRPVESRDAAENLPKEGLRQVAFGPLQDEVPGMMRRPPVL